jgi:hypothetical protein
VIANRDIRHLIGRVLLETAPPPPGDMRVHHRPPYVAIKGRAVGDLVPGEIGLGKRGLHQVLGVRPVTRQSDRHAKEHRSASTHVVTELLLRHMGIAPPAPDAHAPTLQRVIVKAREAHRVARTGPQRSRG